MLVPRSVPLQSYVWSKCSRYVGLQVDLYLLKSLNAINHAKGIRSYLIFDRRTSVLTLDRTPEPCIPVTAWSP